MRFWRLRWAAGDPAQDIDDARVQLAELEAEVWDRVEYNQRPAIAAASPKTMRRGNGKPWHFDWEGLAREWGRLDACGKLSPHPEAPSAALLHEAAAHRSWDGRAALRFGED